MNEMQIGKINKEINNLAGIDNVGHNYYHLGNSYFSLKWSGNCAKYEKFTYKIQSLNKLTSLSIQALEKNTTDKIQALQMLTTGCSKNMTNKT